MFHKSLHPSGTTPLGTGTVAMTDAMRAVAAVATPPLSTGKKLHLLVNLIELRQWFVAMLVAVAMFIGYWDTINNGWGDWTRPAPAASAVELGQEFCCVMHPQLIRAESDARGEAPSCRICGQPRSWRNKDSNP